MEEVEVEEVRKVWDISGVCLFEAAVQTVTGRCARLALTQLQWLFPVGGCGEVRLMTELGAAAWWRRVIVVVGFSLRCPERHRPSNANFRSPRCTPGCPPIAFPDVQNPQMPATTATYIQPTLDLHIQLVSLPVDAVEQLQVHRLPSCQASDG